VTATMMMIGAHGGRDRSRWLVGMHRRRNGSSKMPDIDINIFHHAIHQVSGDMALKFTKATAADLKRWAGALRELAEQMEARTTEKENRRA
jgi:hypothetical protein